MSSQTKPLVLHAHSTGPNPIKIAIALELLKLPYEVKSWEFGDDPKKGVKGSTFLKINENGRVPALQDPNTDVVSWESGAIINYLKRVYDADGKVLGPRGADGGKPSLQDVVDAEKWEYFLLTTLGPMTGQTNWFRCVPPPPPTLIVFIFACTFLMVRKALQSHQERGRAESLCRADGSLLRCAGRPA